jgi:hypothetical protein
MHEVMIGKQKTRLKRRNIMNLKRIILVAAVLIGVAALMFLPGCFYTKEKSDQESTTDQSPDQLSIQDINFSAGSKIATIATLYLGYTPCKYGVGFVSPCGSSSCNGGIPKVGWCAEFAGSIWAKSGVVNTSGLGCGPGGFVGYYGKGDPLPQTPHLGDVAVMSPKDDLSKNSHVAIVTAIDSTGRVTMVGGNEGSGQGKVDYSYYKAGDSERKPVDSCHYRVKGYVAPRLK